MEESFPLDSVGKRLKWAREKHGRFASAAEAARFFGIPHTTYYEHEIDRRRPPRDTAKRYAQVYGVRVEWLFDGTGAPKSQSIQTVQVIGKIVAGSQVEVYQEEEKKSEAPAPIDATLFTVAVEVRGGSMRGIADDGWLIFFEDLKRPPDQSLVGKLCVLQLDDGRVVVRTLQRGRKKGRYDLESTVENTLRDQRVVWAAKVTWIKPR